MSEAKEAKKEEKKEAPAGDKSAEAPEAKVGAKEEEAPKKKGPKTTPPAIANKAKLGKRSMRAEARRIRRKRLQDDAAYAKNYFATRSKRSSEKKVTFRKGAQA